MCIVRQSQNLESGQSCFFGLLTQAPVQKKTLKSFSLYKRSIELVWGKGTLRKARATFKSYQALCLIVPHCASLCLIVLSKHSHTPSYSPTEPTISLIFLKAAKLYLSCSLFVLAIWFIQDVTGGALRSLGFFGCQHGSAWHYVLRARVLLVSLRTCPLPMTSIIERQDFGCLAIMRMVTRWRQRNLVQHRSTSFNMMQLCLEVHQLFDLQ